MAASAEATSRPCTVAKLLDGAQAGPPEDHKGNYRFAETLMVLRNKRHPDYQEVMQSVSTAANTQHMMRKYNFDLFDLEDCQRGV